MFRFTDAKTGRFLIDIDASDADWACLIFIRDWLKGGTILDDIVVTFGNRVVAVMSDRGKRKPDIMILDYMRRRCMAG